MVSVYVGVSVTAHFSLSLPLPLPLSLFFPLAPPLPPLSPISFLSSDDPIATLNSRLVTDEYVLLQWSPPRLASRLHDDIIPDEDGQFNVKGYRLRREDRIIDVDTNTTEYLYQLPMHGAAWGCDIQVDGWLPGQCYHH